jgi:hypothetical protein
MISELHWICTGVEVEYAKARARKERWEEEVLLLEEEIPRSSRFFQHRSAWWNALSTSRDGLDEDRRLTDGLHSYAKRQAYLFEQLGAQMSTQLATAP